MGSGSGGIRVPHAKAGSVKKRARPVEIIQQDRLTNLSSIGQGDYGERYSPLFRW